MRFTSISLRNWRNFTSVHAELADRVFLVGPNASGKSNLLDAFRFLRDVAGAGGGLVNAIEARGGVKRIRCLAARRNPDVSVTVTIGDDDEPDRWTYELQQDPKGRWHLRGKYRHWRAPGAWQDESDLSDGTLRLVGLLWVILDARGTLLLEEPELSLHPEVVRFLPSLFSKAQRAGGSQVILSTHSPDLLRDEGIGLDEVLLLVPAEEGTEVTPASAIADAELLLVHGTPLPELLSSRTRPADVTQLALFQP